MSIIKICGIRNAADAIVAAEHGADFLGFVMAPSKRRVTARDVARIIAELRDAGHDTATVGVFVDPSRDELLGTIETSGIDLVQLSGVEPPDLVTGLGVPG